MAAGSDPQMRRDGFADIGIGVADTDVARAHTGAEAHDRYTLAGMVGAAPGGIAAMVGCHQNHVSGLQLAVNFRKAAVEGFERCGITGYVTPMAEKHVEIDEIGEDEIAVLGLVHDLQRGIHQRHVAIGLDDSGDTLMGEDIADLADGMHLAAGLDKTVEQRGLRWQYGIVAAIAGALEGLDGFADERTGDDAADVERIEQFPDDLAEFEQAFETEMGFVRGNLEDKSLDV